METLIIFNYLRTDLTSLFFVVCITTDYGHLYRGQFLGKPRLLFYISDLDYEQSSSRSMRSEAMLIFRRETFYKVEIRVSHA